MSNFDEQMRLFEQEYVIRFNCFGVSRFRIRFYKPLNQVMFVCTFLKDLKIISKRNSQKNHINIGIKIYGIGIFELKFHLYGGH